MFTYEILTNPPTARIFYDGSIVDVVGPWDSADSANTWAESYVNMKNLGIG